MINFNADEIFEMAEQIERNGAKFYRKAAESIDSKSRDLLLGLAAMEDEHQKTFAAMRGELSDALLGTESIQDILKTAIGLEKDSIVFYTSMKEFVPKTAGPEKVDAIIKEEIGHIVELTNQLTASKK